MLMHTEKSKQSLLYANYITLTPIGTASLVRRCPEVILEWRDANSMGKDGGYTDLPLPISRVVIITNSSL